MEKINAIIVGRNVKLVNSINYVLKEFENILVCNVFANIDAVYKYEDKTNVDIIFWDLEEEGSLEKQFKKINRDEEEVKFICISSNPKNVLEAFRFGAVDFIQKPISTDHLFKAIKKANYMLNSALTISEKSLRYGKSVKFIIVTSLKDVKIITVESIVYMKSEGRYTIIYKQDGEVLVSSKNLGFYEELLKQNNFFRHIFQYLIY